MTTPFAWRPWAVAAAAAVMFLTNLGATRLWDYDEPRNARCGAEMFASGEWVVPTFNDRLRDHKPVLVYWAMIASYATLGVNEFAARLPSALAGIAVVVMTYHMARLLFERSVGLVAAALLASGLMFAVLSRAATPDGVLMVGTTAALLAFVAGVAARRGGRFAGADVAPLASFRLPLGHAVAMYAALGLAVLAKGPIGVLLPLWAICLYGLFGEPLDDRRASRLVGRTGWRRWTAWVAASAAPGRWLCGAWSIRLPMGVAIVAAIAGPWYLAVSLQTSGDWLSGFVGTHNVGRFMQPMEGHGGPIFYYVVAVLAGFFPGSCFLPVAIAGSANQRRAKRPLAASHAFVLACVFAWIGFFSLAATKLPNYVIPCYIALAIGTAAWLVAAMRRVESVRSWLGAGLASCAVAGVAIGGAVAIVGGPLMGGTPLIGLVGLAPLAGGAFGLWALRRGEAPQAVGAYLTGSLAFTLVGLTIVAPLASPYAEGPRLADAVGRFENAGADVRFATYRYSVPSIVWELDRHVPRLNAEETAAFLTESGGVVAMPAEAFASIRDTLPAGVTTLADEGRFLRNDKRVVLVGHRELLAMVDGETRVR